MERTKNLLISKEKNMKDLIRIEENKIHALNSSSVDVKGYLIIN